MAEHDDIEIRNQNELVRALEQTDYILTKKYLNDITLYPVKEPDRSVTETDLIHTMRLNRVDRIVFDKEENNQDKLMNVYNAVAQCGGSIVTVIVSDGENTEFYIGVRTDSFNNITACQETLTGSFEGNFPGTQLSLQRRDNMEALVRSVFGDADETSKCISVVSGIPGFRNTERDGFVQGIEKVADSMRGMPFSLMIVADPVLPERIHEIRESYEDLYTRLSPFQSTVLTYSETESDSVSETVTKGLSKTLGYSVTNTITSSRGTSTGTSKSRSKSAGISPIGIGVTAGVTTGTSSTESRQSGTSQGDTDTKSQSDSISCGKTDTRSNSSGRTQQVTFENRKVSDILKRIEKQIERIDDSADLGLWDTAAYCIGNDIQTCRILSGTLQSLCRGEKSSIENFSVGTWIEPAQKKLVSKYLRRFRHPQLEMQLSGIPVKINPTSYINGRELVIEAGLPQKSMSGVPVNEMTAFSRNVVRERRPGDSDVIKIGRIFHMGSPESTEVCLDRESLSAHTLITGSTGSGKSNTVYTLLCELKKQGVHYLVIEPAKGEYKNVFGREANVYGTNARFGEILRISPFSFPEDIHVLEHVDRLVEIFNVCWPMYAAMPAVLKDAVLQAYKNCGWNLEESRNEYGEDYFPSFHDVIEEVTAVIDYSAYSDEVKGNYIGSLATRIRSLTNGINGQLFCSDEIPPEKLFDEDTIVDLSRVGSTETKSLIMGILVMKLNEYRMSSAKGDMNQPLKHITVLEEAHNLLKSTFVSSSSEGGDMVGKSVEMISNLIAEVRTYGEGFFIVDQSPGAISISAIRNTNTKIIMRLPEESDRLQAGRSAALNDEQIPELAKLNRGVAVIYQNDWLDPVLCKINKADITETVYTCEPSTTDGEKQKSAKRNLLEILMKNRVNEPIDRDIEEALITADNLRIATRTRILLKEALNEIKDGREPSLCGEQSFETLSGVVVEILGFSDDISRWCRYACDMEGLNRELINNIERSIGQVSLEMSLTVSQCIIRDLVRRDEQQVELYSRWREFVLADSRMM